MYWWNFSDNVTSDRLILITVIWSPVVRRYRGRSPFSNFLGVPGRMIFENLTPRSSDLPGTVSGFSNQECERSSGTWGYNGLESD